MAEKAGTPVGEAPKADRPEKIRNVVVVGHSGSGKTTVVEALLAATGTIPRAGRVEDGNTVSDFDESEISQHRSIGLSLAPLVHDGIKVNLLDTPGYADFVGDLRAGLRGGDAALFVVSAIDGIDGTTRMLWDECAAVGVPRAVVLTKLDHPRASFDEALATCQQAFGGGVHAVYVPLKAGDAVTGLMGLITKNIYDYSSGSKVAKEPTADQIDELEAERGDLIEAVISESEDETLMDRYLAGEQIDTTLLIEDLRTAINRASFFPVIPMAAPGGVGTSELLGIITDAFPAPAAHLLPEVTTVDGKTTKKISCDPAGPLVAEIIKTTSDPYVGKISLVRVFSGTLRPDTTVHVSGHGLADRGHEDHDVEERIGTLSSPLGKAQRTVPMCVAGDICAVAKLATAETGDTLSDKDNPLLVEAWHMPEPLLPVAIVASSKADEDKLSTALTRIVTEDPTLRLEHHPETGQLILWCMGEAHADVILSRLKERYGVSVDTVDVRVPLRETLAAKATGHGRHVKQSGGHGQYAVCDIEVEPVPAGTGYEFVDKVFGGSVPRQFIPSVDKGVQAQMEKGLGAGYPVVDLRVTLVDGKAHSVDSSDVAFQIAGGMALKDAAASTQILLLEPVLEVSILVADEYVGAFMSDLSSRRGRVLGTEPVGSGRTMVKAEVPEIEMVRYAIDLRSMSQGTGSFTRKYVRHDPMPHSQTEKILKETQEK